VGKHNAQEIRAHRQHVDEQLIKLETRQKALLAQLALGTKNREPRTELKEPGTGTERTGTKKIGSCSVPDSLEPNYPGSSVRFLG
jgi:hypothetical protein